MAWESGGGGGITERRLIGQTAHRESLPTSPITFDHFPFVVRKVQTFPKMPSFPIVLSLFLIPILWPFATAQKQQQKQQQADSPVSHCLKHCLEPMTQLEKTVSFMYRHYEAVCEKLEWSANCAQSCKSEDRGAFFQFTTFYRMHCVDFEEELEEHLPCLKEAAFKADVVCRERCAPKETAEKQNAKEERQKMLCKNVECSTLCYVQQLANGCPKAKDTIIRLNIRIADEMRRLTRDSDFDKLSVHCQRVHDANYMRKRLDEVTKKNNTV
ncbi:hypothetical protein niasHS_017522 [Heterodera schachtii]|uniref:Chondroitin proteoglycan 4 domain-containing protein n=1 Tax=Heterodera schachtii TaxID=97005 RepID=A0ABD2I8R5_HETSC